MPLNSAGLHTGGQVTADRVLLWLSLLAPCVFFAARELRQQGGVGASRFRREVSEDGHTEASGLSPRREIQRSGSYRSMGEPQEKVASVMLMGSLKSDQGDLVRDALSGAVVSLGCIPEAISFSMIVGISPLNGIWAGIFMGLYSSLLGGRPGMVSCSSAATAVVLASVAQDFGMGAMGLTVVICGALQCLAGACYLSRFIALVPHPVMLGFVNGLAIVIARAQLRQFREHGDGEWLDAKVVQGMILTIIVCMGSAMAAPRLPVIGRWLPGPLVAIVTAVVFSCAISPWFPQRTLEQAAGPDTFAGGAASLPSWNFPPAGVDWTSGRMWACVLVTAPRMALVGLVESLLTVKLLDQITGQPGSTRRECFGQGLGNIVAGLFGTQGGCALIGQSLINVSGGGRSRLSGFVMSSGLAASVLLLAPWVGKIPIAALVGLMFLVAINTFAWGSLGLLHLVSWTDAVVIAVVTGVTIAVDLATAVLTGLFISALSFAWSAAKEVRLVDDPEGDNARVFRLQGPLFFGSAMSFQSRIRPERVPENEVILDFSKGKVLDHSGLDAITKVIDRLHAAGKKVHCRALPLEATAYLRQESTADRPAGQ